MHIYTKTNIFDAHCRYTGPTGAASLYSTWSAVQKVLTRSHQMRVNILMDELKNAATSPTGNLFFGGGGGVKYATPYNPWQNLK